MLLLYNGSYSLINKIFWEIWSQDEFNNVYKYDISFRNNLTNNGNTNYDNCQYKLNNCLLCYYNTKIIKNTY